MAEKIKIYQCLNRELQYHGLKFIGLLTAAFTCIILLLKFDFTFALIGSVGGYVVGASISPYWYKGYIQKWVYFHLPTRLITRSKRFPQSCDRKFL